MKYLWTHYIISFIRNYDFKPIYQSLRLFLLQMSTRRRISAQRALELLYQHERENEKSDVSEDESPENYSTVENTGDVGPSTAAGDEIRADDEGEDEDIVFIFRRNNQ